MDYYLTTTILSRHSDSIPIEEYRQLVLEFAVLAPNPKQFALSCGIII